MFSAFVMKFHSSSERSVSLDFLNLRPDYQSSVLLNCTVTMFFEIRLWARILSAPLMISYVSVCFENKYY